jgi:hypothetical protein
VSQGPSLPVPVPHRLLAKVRNFIAPNNPPFSTPFRLQTISSAFSSEASELKAYVSGGGLI